MSAAARGLWKGMLRPPPPSETFSSRHKGPSPIYTPPSHEPEYADIEELLAAQPLPGMNGFNRSSPVDGLTKDQADSWTVKFANQAGTALRVLRKAMSVMPAKPDQDLKGHFYDPDAFYQEHGGYRERPSGLTYDTLRAMANRTPIIAAIHQTRLNQIGIFGRPRSEPTEMGFVILPKSLQEQENPSRATFKKIQELTEFFALCGTKYKDRHYLRPNLEAALRMMCRDSLTFDQYGIQLNPDRMGRPSEFVVMAAHSLRLASRFDDDGSWNFDPDDTHYVQVERYQVIEEFTARELIWGVRNPRSDLEIGGYGLGELELLMQVVTGMLWAEQYNYRFFSSGSTIKGLLNIKGFINRAQLRAFRREWFALLSGVHNAWRTPVINAEEVQFIPMHASNRDMEFTEWLYYLLKIASAVYQIDPSEINFLFGNEGQAVQVFETNNEAKTRLSRDRGLRPLVINLQQSLQRILDEIDANFMILLAGLDAKTEEQKASLAETLTRSVWTIDEARDRLYQMPPLETAGGIVRSGEYLAYLNQLAQLAAAEEEMKGAVDSNGEPKFPMPEMRQQAA
jgi:hypothetical protein